MDSEHDPTVSAVKLSKASLIYITPFIEALTEDQTNGSYCYLLEIDSSKILLDCGVRFDTDSNRLMTDHITSSSSSVSLRSIAKDIDAVLCTHSSLSHIGGLPFLISLLPKSVPIYMTMACQSMARILFSEICNSSVYPPAPFSSEDGAQVFESKDHSSPFSSKPIDELFNRITGLRFSQPINLSGKADGIFVVPLPAGHSLGGCFWKIRKGHEDIIYAVEFNMKKERHLEGSLITSINTRPSVFITDATRALSLHQSRKGRDTEFVETILGHLKNVKGDVLVPISPTGSILELLLLLETYWSSTKCPYEIYFVGQEASRLLDFAKSMLEWMGESVLKSFGASRENPFDLKSIKFSSSYEEFDLIQCFQSTNSPKVILAFDEYMQFSGLSRQFLIKMINDPKSLILFTCQSPPFGSLSRMLKDICVRPSAASKPHIHFTVYDRDYLDELGLKEMKKDTKIDDKGDYSIDLNDDYVDDEDEYEGADRKHIDDHPEYEKKPQALQKLPSISQSMFSFKEKKKPHSVYGEVLDPNDWPAFAFGNASAKSIPIANKDGISKDPIHENILSMEIENIKETFPVYKSSATPYRIKNKEHDGPVECHLKWINFYSVSDGKSIITLVERLMPRKVVLVHGSESCMTFLSHSIDVLLLGGSSGDDNHNDERDDAVVVISPEKKRTNISILSNMFDLKLSERLFSSLKFYAKSGYEICRVDGIIKASSLDEEDDQVECSQSDSVVGVNGTPYLDVKKVKYENKSIFSYIYEKFINTMEDGPPGVFDTLIDRSKILMIGDPKISELRKILQNDGFHTEFKSGRLIVNKTISIAKNVRGEIVLEGAISSEYFKVKQIIKEQFVRI